MCLLVHSFDRCCFSFLRLIALFFACAIHAFINSYNLFASFVMQLMFMKIHKSVQCVDVIRCVIFLSFFLILLRCVDESRSKSFILFLAQCEWKETNYKFIFLYSFVCLITVINDDCLKSRISNVNNSRCNIKTFKCFSYFHF